MPTIRLATAADVPAIARLMAWATESTTATFTIFPESEQLWAERFRQGHAMYPWFVAEEDGQVLGFAKAGVHRPREAYAYTVETAVYLFPEHHGRGIGKRLYDRLFATLHAQGYYTAVAGVTAGNLASERLHLTIGMRPVGTFHRCGWKFQRWHDVTFYELALQDEQQTPGDLLPVAAVT